MQKICSLSGAQCYPNFIQSLKPPVIFIRIRANVRGNVMSGKMTLFCCVMLPNHISRSDILIGLRLSRRLIGGRAATHCRRHVGTPFTYVSVGTVKGLIYYNSL